ncbi:MAG: RnfABCDGE type electron transport complex subunit G [Clostridia bacterium]|nr:RnfABCDGE type electron transport complex subunit G [Clostridia bacterium]
MRVRRIGRLPGYLALLIITLVAALALGATYTLTEERIFEQSALAAEKARFQVMPDADAFEKIPTEDDQIKEVYQALKAGEMVGYVAVTDVNGYGGEIEIVAGFTLDGTITGISVGGANFKETPGLGAKAKEKAFSDRFIGKIAPIGVVKAGKTAGENDVDAIASATITSNAVAGGVNSIAEYISKTMIFEEGA